MAGKNKEIQEVVPKHKDKAKEWQELYTAISQKIKESAK